MEKCKSCGYEFEGECEFWGGPCSEVEDCEEHTGPEIDNSQSKIVNEVAVPDDVRFDHR